MSLSPDPMAAPDDGAKKPRWPWLSLLAVGLVLSLGYVGVELYLLGELGFPLDDSWIHLQFARNLASGEGLSYQDGELVTGSTAPLWTALVSLVFLLPGSPVFWVKVLGIAFYLAGAWATYLLARELQLGERLAWLAALLTLASRWVIWSAPSGMEIPLFICLSLWGTILHLRERRASDRLPLSLVVLAVAVLARPEGMLLLVLAVIDRCVAFERGGEGSRWRPASIRETALGIALGALILLPPVLFNRVAGGSALPTTFSAKASKGASLLPGIGEIVGDPGRLLAWLPSVDYLYHVPMGVLFLGSQPHMVLLAGAGAVLLFTRLGSERDAGILPALWLVALPLAYASMSSLKGAPIAGNFGRYFFPLFPYLVVLGVLGLEPLFGWIDRRFAGSAWRRRWLAILVLLLLAPVIASAGRSATFYSQNVVNVQDSDIKIARWLAVRLPPAAVVAVNDVGAIKYILPNRVIDMAGIIHPQMPIYIREAQERGLDGHHGVMRFLDEMRPDYLVVFPKWYPGLDREGSEFRRLYQLEIADNITMGDDEIVVYSTPWARYPLADPAAGVPGGNEG
jgi:hypothetical protein